MVHRVPEHRDALRYVVRMQFAPLSTCRPLIQKSGLVLPASRAAFCFAELYIIGRMGHISPLCSQQPLGTRYISAMNRTGISQYSLLIEVKVDICTRLYNRVNNKKVKEFKEICCVRPGPSISGGRSLVLIEELIRN
jgi:hypothetical protein